MPGWMAPALEIGGGIDAEHAGQRRRASPVSMLRMMPWAMRLAHHHRMAFAAISDVVGVATGAAQKLRILLARHWLADAELHQRQIGAVHPSLPY